MSTTPELTRERVQKDPIEHLGRRMLAELVQHGRATEATFWVLSEDGTKLDGALNHGKTPEILESTSVPIDDSVVGMVAATQAGTIIGPDDEYNVNIDQKTGTKTLAMVAAPVFFRDQICGVISAINPKDGKLFEGQDLDLVSWKAYLLGLILDDCSAKR